VSKVSLFQKLGAASRVAGRLARKSRTLNAALGAVSSTARSFARTLHHLWLEVIGTLFLAMAAFGAMTLVREYVKYAGGHTTPGRLGIAFAFTATFAWFGISSFWRVKKSSRQRSL